VNKEEKRYDLEIASFGQRIKQIRETKELTQLDLELSAGIDRTEISRIENGARNVEFFTMVKLAIALNVNLSDFFPKNED
jgi:transcriptional regulator with XRE-family HTH domain